MGICRLWYNDVGDLEQKNVVFLVSYRFGPFRVLEESAWWRQSTLVINQLYVEEELRNRVCLISTL